MGQQVLGHIRPEHLLTPSCCQSQRTDLLQFIVFCTICMHTSSSLFMSCHDSLTVQICVRAEMQGSVPRDGGANQMQQRGMELERNCTAITAILPTKTDILEIQQFLQVCNLRLCPMQDRATDGSFKPLEKGVCAPREISPEVPFRCVGMENCC